MKRAIAAVCLIALGACGQTQSPEPPGAQPEFLDLLCSAFEHASADALTRAYGANNLAEQMLPGPEGESYIATVLFPDDPTRRVEIVWRDPATRTAPESVSVRGPSSWIGDNGLAIGDSLARVEARNGQPFRLWGFGWDNGGWVSEWSGGLYAPSNGCVTRVRFEARARSHTALGDSEFASDSGAVRAANPVVAEFGLSFASPNAE